MKLSYLSIMLICSALLGQDAFGSKALEERGASCTEHCTKGGKNILKLPEAYKQHPGVVLWNFLELKAKVEEFNKSCGPVAEADMKGPVYAGNVNWCEKNCKGGGLLSTLKGRQKEVEDFVKARKDECHKAAVKFLSNYKDSLSYKAGETIKFKPGAVPPEGAPPAPPAPLDAPPAPPAR